MECRCTCRRSLYKHSRRWYRLKLEVIYGIGKEGWDDNVNNGSWLDERRDENRVNDVGWAAFRLGYANGREGKRGFWKVDIVLYIFNRRIYGRGWLLVEFRRGRGRRGGGREGVGVVVVDKISKLRLLFLRERRL